MYTNKLIINYAFPEGFPFFSLIFNTCLIYHFNHTKSFPLHIKWPIRKVVSVHSRTFLIGRFYFAVISTSTQPISSISSAFNTDVCLYRNLLKLASLLPRSVVQLYHYWFLHFRCDVIIWNTQMIKNWLVMFYDVYCCIKTFYIM